MYWNSQKFNNKDIQGYHDKLPGGTIRPMRNKQGKSAHDVINNPEKLAELAQCTSKQRALQLRKTHFTLGEGQKYLNRSEYNNIYKMKNKVLQKAILQGSTSHFKLGTAPSRKSFHRVSDMYFKHHKNFVPNKISPEQQRIIRNSSVTLGNWIPRMQTTNGRNFYSKKSDIPTKKEQDARIDQQRLHNYKFSDDNVRQFNTLYNRAFNRDLGKRTLTKTKEQLQQDALKLRASNIVLGTDNPVGNSEFQSKYNKKDVAYKFKKRIERGNVVIGNQKDDMLTSFKDYFKEHKVNPNPVDPHVIEKHRSTHFKLGTDKQYLTSLQQRSFKNPDIAKLPTKHEGSYATNYKLGINKKQFSSQYNDKYTSFNLNYRNVKNTRFSSTGTTKDFSLGEQGNNYVSEFQHSYHNKKSKNAGLDHNMIKDLKSSHFKFNDLKRPSLNTINMSQYKTPGKLGPTLLDNGYNGVKGVERGISTHFKVGNSKTKYNSSMQGIHTPLHGECGKLGEGKVQDLKSDHFNVRDKDTGPITENTVYRTKYPWKVRVDQM